MSDIVRNYVNSIAVDIAALQTLSTEDLSLYAEELQALADKLSNIRFAAM